MGYVGEPGDLEGAPSGVLHHSSEHHTDDLLNTLGAHVWRANLRGHITSANRAWLDYTGLVPLVEAWRPLHPEERAAASSVERCLLDGRSAGELEARVRRRDGLYRWFLIRVEPVFDASGELDGMVGTALDIHERRRREREAVLLAEAGRALGRSLDIETTLREVAWCALPDLGDFAIADLATGPGEVRRVTAVHREPAMQPLVDSLHAMPLARTHPLWEVLRERRAVAVGLGDDYPERATTDEPSRAHLRRLGPRHLVCTPLLYQGRVLGALSFYSTSPRALDPRDLVLAARLAELAAGAVASAQAQEQLERALSEKNEALRHLEGLYDHSPLGLAVFDERGRFVRVNERLAAINGIPVEEHLGKSVAEVLPGVWPAFEPTLERALRGEEFEFEVSGTLPGAPTEVGFWREFVFPLPSGRGAGTGFVLGVLDVTEHRRTEIALSSALSDLAEEHRRFLAIIEATRVGVVHYDAEGRVAYINHAGAAALGYLPEELLGRHGHDTLHYLRPNGARLPVEECETMQAIARGESYQGEPVAIAKDGRFVPLEVNAVPLRDEHGNLAGSVVVFQDITPRVEETKRREELAAAAAHEMLNPLTAVVGAARLLERRTASTVDDESHQLLLMLLNEAERLGRTTETFLDMSRLETGVFSLFIEEAELDSLVHHEVNLLRRRYPDVRVVEEYLEDALTLHTDGPRVRQVLGTLLDNAARFGGDSGPVEVSVRLDGDFVRIAVRDHGAGITASERAHIFERYYRGSQALRRRSQGLGLGLYISRQIAERLGGSLTLDSPEEEGPEFVLRLPLTSVPVRRPTA